MKSTLAALLFFLLIAPQIRGQGKWQRFISNLDSKRMSLTVGGMAGCSYFMYDTKAITKHFPTAEATLEVLLSKRLNDYFQIETGIRTGIKFKKSPGYDYDSPEIQLEDWQYSLIEVDQSLSEYSHLMFGVPLTVQYKQKKLTLGLGGSYRHFSIPRNNGYPSDVFAGQNEGGLLGTVRYPLGSHIRLGVDYYYGLVNIHHQGSWVAYGGPNKIDYRTFSRVAQFACYYTFGVR